MAHQSHKMLIGVIGIFLVTLDGGNDHEIKFHEIEIAIFQEIKSFEKLIMGSKLAFFRRLKLGCFL